MHYYTSKNKSSKHLSVTGMHLVQKNKIEGHKKKRVKSRLIDERSSVGGKKNARTMFFYEESFSCSSLR